MLDSKCQIFWTRTLFLGVNPKDSTRTRLVLDTLRLVLDSYSKNLDSIQHYCHCAKANIIYQNQFKTTFEFYSVNIIL